jgi:dCMP deaminase
MSNRPTRDDWAMSIAKITAKQSTCKRRAVGAVLVNFKGHILATGYNGVASKQPHCIDAEHACVGADTPIGVSSDTCQALHAEQNALLQCKNMYDIHTAYVTLSPCITCCKLLLNTSCQRIVFLDEYPHGASKELWTSAGREWIKYEARD